MAFSRAIFQCALIGCVLYLALAKSGGQIFDEPECSKFHFEEKVLEKLVRLDFNVEQSSESVKGELLSLKDKARELKAGLDILEEGQEKERNDLKAELVAEISVLKDELAQLKKELNERQAAGKSHGVAFVARNPPTNLPASALIHFHTTVLNVGDAFDESTGRFTAPVSGIYSFTAQLCTKQNYVVRFQLMVDNNILAVSQHMEKDFNGACMSMSTVATMQAGKQAWVNCANSGVILVADGNTTHWSMFTGVLVAPN